MRVAFDVAQTCTQKAGCGYYADSLAQALAETADIERLILLHHFGSWINFETAAGTAIESERVSAPFKGLSHEAGRDAWKAIQQGTREFPESPQIVHSCSYRAPRTPGIPLVFTVHDVCFWTHPEFTTEANRIECQTGLLDALKHATGFIFVSKHARDEFEKVTGGWLAHTGRPWTVIHSAPRRFPETDHSPANIPERYWLAVGSVEPRKNYEAILDAHEIYCRAVDQPAPLLIAGSRGWLSDDIHRRIAALPDTQVRYLGFVSDEDLGYLYRHSLGCLFPSWYEGFGLPVIEAMANGCPVICSDRASIPEVAGDAALYIDPADPRSISDAMAQIHSRPDLYSNLRQKGLNRSQAFTWAKTAQKTAAFYQTVVRAYRDIRRSDD